jgi:hypothetical protein
MDVRKLWENAGDSSEFKTVCDVYGAEHLARLIGECVLVMIQGDLANL